MQMDTNKGADMQTTYTRTRYVVKYWSRYRVNWVSVLVEVQTEDQIAEILADQGITEFEIIRNCGRSL